MELGLDPPERARRISLRIMAGQTRRAGSRDRADLRTGAGTVGADFGGRGRGRLVAAAPAALSHEGPPWFNPVPAGDRLLHCRWGGPRPDLVGSRQCLEHRIELVAHHGAE